VVVAPGTPADNHGLLLSALESGDPVVYMEHKELWPTPGAVTVGKRVPLGQARVARTGSDVTLVSWSRQMLACEQAANQLATQGVQAEVIDLRTIWPWDKATVLESVAKTGRLLVVHEAIQVAGFGAEIAATVAEHTSAKVARLGAPRIPVGYASSLEAEARIGPDKIVAAVQRLVQR
jgi:pyruvate dehydrogenase E1 component beta subunit